MTMKKILVPSLMALAFVACTGTESSTDDGKSEVVAVEKGQAQLGSFGIELQNVDASITPGDDFFRYVNGKWLEKTEIPADRSRYGSFGILRDLSEERVKVIIETAAKDNAPEGSDRQKVGDFYKAFMDVDAIEAAGLSVAEADLAKIASANTHTDITSLMSDPALGLPTIVAPFVSVDLKDVDNYIVYLTQSGLGMPNRDYYFDDSEKGKALQDGYRDLLAKMLV